MDQEQRITRLEKWAKIIIALLIVVMLITLYIILFSKHNSYNDTQLRQSIDSMRVHDKDRLYTIHQLESRIQQDSTRTASTKLQVAQVPIMIANINHKYDIQRTHITQLSDDEQLQLFTNWLSQTDSL